MAGARDNPIERRPHSEVRLGESIGMGNKCSLELRAGENLRKTSRWAAKGVTRGRRLKPPEPELNTR